MKLLFKLPESMTNGYILEEVKEEYGFYSLSWSKNQNQLIIRPK